MSYVFSIFTRNPKLRISTYHPPTPPPPHALSFDVKYDMLIAEMKRIFEAIRNETVSDDLKCLHFF